MFKRNKFLFLSVFAHLIVLYVFAQSVLFPSVVDSPPKKPNIIQATLIFDLPPPPKDTVAVIEEEKPLPIEPEEVIPVAETPEDSQIKPVAEPEVEVPTIPPPQSKQQAEMPEESEQNNEVVARDKNTPPIGNSDISSDATGMARRHLNRFQQQQQRKVAEQASRYYQKHKNSPVIADEVKDPFMTEEEKMRDNLKVRADCSSASKQTTAVLLGFLGAQIDCTKPPPINRFIQDRINKKSHLPDQHQQPDKKRPESVVIKK